VLGQRRTEHSLFRVWRKIAPDVLHADQCEKKEAGMR
jgi:hypothetical protein